MKGANLKIQFPESRCLHQQLELYAKNQPDAPALIFKDQTLSFQELDNRSSTLAEYLQLSGIQRGDFVALCLNRSIDMIVGVFAILKAGGAYVPIDVDYPSERLAFMIQDANAKIILSESSLKTTLPATNASVICMDTDWPNIAQQCPKGKYNFVSEPDDLAYTIFTSGSTGKPKGVMITHRNVMNQLEGQQDIAPNPIGRMLLTCSISFDVSVLTIFWSLLQGAPLVLPQQGEEKDIARLADIVELHKVTHILTLPSLHTLILEQAPPEKLATLELVNVSGEVCPTPMAQKHEKLLPHTQLYNLYGPTEATVNCTFFTIPKGFDAPKVPIGRPILNYEILILDENLNEVPYGEVGEIYIGGSKDVVGKGYWNRAELSAERFIDNPHEAVRGGKKLYKTGDLARWMEDGNVEFLGRADYQVKFRGFRIELGEIEVAIGNHPAVKETVVLLKNQHEVNNQKLVAYLVLEPGQQVNVSELRAYMEETLPEYMLPSNFVFLDKMPLTTNGKFDRKALPEPNEERPDLAQAYRAPDTALEKHLVQIWENLLQLSPIGINDKFFELGGNSIQAAQFIGDLQKELNTSIFITTIFDCPTIAEYAAMLEKDYTEAVETFFHTDNTSHKEDKRDSLTQEAIDSFEQYVPLLEGDIPKADKKSAKNAPAMFILAPPRSGTSLLRTMLAGHPDLFAVNELQLLGFHTLKERTQAYSGKFKLWLEGAIRTVMELKDCDADKARAILHNFEEKDYTTKALFNEIQNWIGDKMLLDKSPSYVLDPAALEKAERDFNHPIYIHLVRHPYSMVTSFVRYHMDQVLYLHEHDFSARELGELVWLQSHKNAINFLKNIPTERQFRVVYEDLVTDPEGTMRALCNQIGLEYHPGLLNPYDNLEEKMVDGIYKDSRSMSDVNFFKHKGINPAMAKAADKVKEDNFLSSNTWDIAQTLGYNHPEEKEIDKKTTSNNNDIAIIGMSVRLPGADSLHEFWLNLVNGTDVGKEITADDLIKAGLNPELLNDPKFVNRSYTLNDPDCFDASFFGYHPKEAAMMDPQHRVFLETAYSALESAGYNPSAYDGRIGVFGGVARNAYFTENIATHPDLLNSAGEYQDTLGTEKSFSVTRVAYKLDLKGPAVNVQTACSSSGVAIHLACQSILNGDADMVLAGGGRIQPPLNAGYQHFEGGPLSPDGYIRAFDADAKGMVRGNGMAIIVLKKVEKAIEDGDYIWATIKGTAINNDGSEKIGFTAPSIKGQADAIKAAQEKAGVSPESINYIEAHGTGTILGDPIEIEGLKMAFKSVKEKQSCAIGSVKTNIGHLDAGACVAGIIKTALSMKYELLPPSLNFKNPNPQIDFENAPFYVNNKLTRWEKSTHPRRAGVSSFGLGGTNAHVVLEEAPEVSAVIADTSHHLLLLSAKTEEAIVKASENMAEFLERKPDQSLVDVAFTLAKGRQSFKYRNAIVAKNHEQAAASLNKGKNQKLDKAVSSVVFMFPGGGAQYISMARDLYQEAPIFKKYLDQCFDILQRKEQLDIKTLIFPNENDPLESLQTQLEQPANALASLLSVEYAMAKTFMAWGIQPSEMIGHSMGEYTAACLAGVFSLEDALSLVTLRGRLFESLPAEGGMLSVPLSPAETEAYLNEDLTISVINRPNSCVVSGTVHAINELEKVLIEKGIEAKKIHISVAAHSPQIDPILDEFKAFLEKIEFKKPHIPFVSNVSGTWAKDEEVIQPEYWLKHIRQTVRFSDGLATLFDLEDRLLLEVGPGQTLCTFARQHPEKNSKQVILASIRHPKEPVHDLEFLLKTLGKAWMAGLNIDWDVFYSHSTHQRVPMPTYPFARKRHWIAPNQAVQTEASAAPVNTNIIAPTPVTEAQVPTATPAVVTAPGISRRQRIINEIKEVLFELSGLEPEEMDEEATFLELGFDSLFLTQAITEFNQLFKLNITFRQLFEEAPNIDALADFVDHHLPEGMFEDPAPASMPVAAPAIDANLAQNLNNLSPNADIGTAIASALSGTITQIVQQQLQQMLGQQPGLAKMPAAKPVAKAKPTKSDGKEEKPSKGFGPWKPVSGKIDNSFTEVQQKNLVEFLENYNKKTKGSKELTASQRKHLSDPRAIQAFNKLWKEGIYQIAMQRSKGSKLWDIDGNEYIDFLMSFGIGLFGHTPDFVQDAVKQQIELGTELSVQTPLAKDVADLICELTGMERACLVNTGSEAVSASVRIARTVTGKNRIAVFEGDYHGISDEMLVRGINVRGKTKSMPIAPGIPKFLVENVLVLYYDDPNVLDVIREHADELAGIIFEPVQTQMPHIQHRQLIHEIRDITEELNIAMIFDELVTGFRLTQRGAQGWYDVDVDISAYGKICSGGMPMAAVAGKARFLDAFDGGQWQYGDDSFPEAPVTFFGGTFVKHPVSMAASKALLQELKIAGPALQESLNAKGAKYAERLKALFLDTKAPLAVKSSASIIAVKVIDNHQLSKLFFHMLRYHGIYMTERAGFVSTAHSEADLDKAINIFRTAIQEMFDRAFFLPWEGEDLNEIIYPYTEPVRVRAEVLENGVKKVPLTEGQEEIWISNQFSREASAAYNLATEIRLEGDFDQAAMERAIQKLVDRHEALRTVFGKESAYQLIYPKRNVDVPFVDLSEFDKSTQEVKLKALHETEAEELMDLYEGPLCRFKIVKMAAEVHLVFITVHHIISDGWSLGIVSTDLGELYASEIGTPAKDLKPPKQLGAFALEEINGKQTDAFAKSEKYWVDQFKEDVPVLEFPTDRSRPPIKTFNSSMEKIVLSKEVYNDLRKTAAKQGTTFYVFVYAAFQAFIHRLSQQDDFVLGVVAAGQSIAGNQDLVGHSVSLLPVRMQTNGEIPFAEHLKKARSVVLDAFDHQNYTLGSLVKQLKLPRDLSRQPIVSILFNMDNAFNNMNFGGLQVSTRAIPRHYETFDIFINIKLLENGVAFEWIYNTDLFNQDTIQRRLREFETLLNGIVENPGQLISKLPLLPEEEKSKVLKEWNQTKAKYPLDKTIHELFEQQVERTPNSVALQYREQVLTYSQLNKKVNQLAHYMQSQGIAKGDFVGIYFERSAEMVISLLATLKLGAIYIPLDPVNPSDRLQLILEDVDAKYLLTHQRLKNRLPRFEGKVICLEDVQKQINKASAENPGAVVDAKDLAYVIYTSGSTGKPKGVAIPHYTVVDHHMAICDKIGVTEEDSIFAVASVAFDPSVQDFFLPLFIGAKTIVAGQDTVVDGFLLKEALDTTQPTLMQATPSTWRMLLLAGWSGNKNLKILSGGEGLTKDLAQELISRSAQLWNIYGPTETTIWSTAKKLEGDRLKTIGETSYEPVGSPINNVQVYILDKHMQPVPIGVGGEIYIGGIGVAPNGYYKRPDLTAQTFIRNPFQENGMDSKLYRTGDLARYLSNGDIEYLSRGDKQVKIRGFRIELGEIESAIAAYPEVRENILMVREDQPGNKQLVAYIIPKGQKKIDFSSLKLFLKDKLPEYMVPAAFVQLEAFPMTASMKVNRKKLPAPEFIPASDNREFQAPSTETEQVIAKIWKELLGLDKISVNDNFFELGGHSLIAVNMMAKIDRALSKKLPLATLLENSTIKLLARLLDGEANTPIIRSLVPIKSTGNKPPIYLVHGAGLHVLLFQTLAQHMDEDQPIYALQARGLHGEAEPLNSIEEIASHYIGEILEQNAEGPYCLAGYSYGGIIAFEMAKQLQAMGKEVNMLAMLDTVVRGAITGEQDSKKFGERVVSLSRKAAWNIKDAISYPSSSLKYRSYVLKRSLRRWMFKVRNKNDQNGQQNNYAALVDKKNLEAFYKYRIQPYNGKIHLFRAKERRFYMNDQEFLGWKPYINGNIMIHEVPGDHLTLFDPPNGKVFAEIFQRCLDDIFEYRDQKIEA